MVDNLDRRSCSAWRAAAPVFNPRYKDFADHFGFTIPACAAGRAHEKGRVENAVGYVKKNFLAGLELGDFRAGQPRARLGWTPWPTCASTASTHRQSVELFQDEKPRLRPLNPSPYDVGGIQTVRAASSSASRSGHQPLFGARPLRRRAPDAQGLPGPRLPLSPGPAHRPARALLRPCTRTSRTPITRRR